MLSLNGQSTVLAARNAMIIRAQVFVLAASAMKWSAAATIILNTATMTKSRSKAVSELWDNPLLPLETRFEIAKGKIMDLQEELNRRALAPEQSMIFGDSGGGSDGSCQYCGMQGLHYCEKKPKAQAVPSGWVLAQAAIAYDDAIQACANSPETMSSFCTASGETLDFLYDAWISKARAIVAASPEQAEPVAAPFCWIYDNPHVSTPSNEIVRGPNRPDIRATWKPLYTHPIPAAPAVPEGWQLMPIVPTTEMWDAACEAFPAIAPNDLSEKVSAHEFRAIFAFCYGAMTAALPERQDGGKANVPS